MPDLNSMEKSARARFEPRLIKLRLIRRFKLTVGICRMTSLSCPDQIPK